MLFWNIVKTVRVTGHGCQCVKNVKISSFFWSVLSSIQRIQCKYRKIRTSKNSLFGHFHGVCVYSAQTQWPTLASWLTSWLSSADLCIWLFVLGSQKYREIDKEWKSTPLKLLLSSFKGWNNICSHVPMP